MPKTSNIPWCDSSFTPWIGCTKVDEMCAHCWAEHDQWHRFGRAQWGDGHPRHRTSGTYWKQPLRWDRAAAEAYAAHIERCAGISGPLASPLPIARPRVFGGHSCDWLDEEVPIEWLADYLDLIRRTPHLDWLLLTKRPQNWQKRMLDASLHLAQKPTENVDLRVWLLDWIDGKPPANVWVGTSVGTQKSADERIPALLQIPARVRFLSCEPLLEEVSFRWAQWDDWTDGQGDRRQVVNELDSLRGLHWVICGCESGHKRRPMMATWANRLKTQCQGARVAFFMKQMEVDGKVTEDIAAFPSELQVREFPEVAA